MEFLLVASAHFLALLSPGPDFFLIGQTTLKYPIRSTTILIAGISIANGVYLFLAISGVEFLKQSAEVFYYLKYLGGGYLLYLGVLMLKAPKTDFAIQDENLRVKSGQLHFFSRGFLSGILNPKNMIFYLSIFTVMVSETTGYTLRILYALWMVILVFCWDLFVAKMISHVKVKKHLGRSVYYIEKLSGLALASFGIGLTLG